MHPLRATMVAIGLGVTLSSSMSSHEVSSDYLPASTVFIPQGYDGFNWLGGSDFDGFDPTTGWLLSSLGNAYECPTYCQLHQPVSGTQNAWGNAGSNLVLSRGSPFDLQSIFLAGTDLRGDPSQTVRGFYQGVEIYTEAVSLDPGLLMQQYTLDFVGVDEVRFDGRNGYGNLLIDDIAYSVTPEPATMILFATGLIALVWAHRLRGSRTVRRELRKAAATAEIALNSRGDR